MARTHLFVEYRKVVKFIPASCDARQLLHCAEDHNLGVGQLLLFKLEDWLGHIQFLYVWRGISREGRPAPG